MTLVTQLPGLLGSLHPTNHFCPLISRCITGSSPPMLFLCQSHMTKVNFSFIMSYERAFLSIVDPSFALILNTTWGIQTHGASVSPQWNLPAKTPLERSWCLENLSFHWWNLSLAIGIHANSTCLKRPLVLKDHIFRASRWSFQTGFALIYE